MNRAKFSLLAAISLATAFTFSFTGCAAPKLSHQEISYSETVDVQGMEKDDLFMKINLWSSEAFNGSDNTGSKVISTNPEQGLVVARHTNFIQMEGGISSSIVCLVYSKVTIAADNERYNIMFEVANVQHTWSAGGRTGSSKVFEPNMVAAGIYKDANALNLTKTVWHELADALRSTLSGTVVSNLQIAPEASAAPAPAAAPAPVASNNETYNSVKIGNQIWMADNLNNANGKCYENNAANCEKYGKMYDWATAKTACPSGWHLPSKAEWDVLMATVGGEKTLNSYGFAALPGGLGFSNGSFFYAGEYGYLWSASEYDANNAYAIGITHKNGNAGWGESGYFKSALLSVRCLKD